MWSLHGTLGHSPAAPPCGVRGLPPSLGPHFGTRREKGAVKAVGWQQRCGLEGRDMAGALGK